MLRQYGPLIAVVVFCLAILPLSLLLDAQVIPSAEELKTNCTKTVYPENYEAKNYGGGTSNGVAITNILNPNPPSGDGNQSDSLTHEWMRQISKTALPRIRYHDLRHAHATHLLSSGAHPKVASERLGHSKVGITLDLYSHVLPGMQEDAAARVDGALQAALQKRMVAKG